VDVIVYVETNFLMSVAMGREARGDDLLTAVSASVRVAIPSGCYMESFSALEDEQKRRTGSEQNSISRSCNYGETRPLRTQAPYSGDSKRAESLTTSY
jgi:hypothetical protein